MVFGSLLDFMFIFLEIIGEHNMPIKYISGDDHIFHIHEYNLDFKANEIYLVGENTFDGFGEEGDHAEPGVEYEMATKFIKNLNILTRKAKDPIFIHMKTCGGDWMEGMAIYDAIKLCPNHVTILNYTHARSMSSIIYLAADYRVMMPHSTYMFHEGDFGTEGPVKRVRTDFNELEKDRITMMNLYVNHLKNTPHGSMKSWSKARIKNWIQRQMNLKEDVYFNANESIKLGFADAIFDGDWQAITTVTK